MTHILYYNLFLIYVYFDFSEKVSLVIIDTNNILLTD